MKETHPDFVYRDYQLRSSVAIFFKDPDNLYKRSTRIGINIDEMSFCQALTVVYNSRWFAFIIHLWSKRNCGVVWIFWIIQPIEQNEHEKY
eukprot:UN05532